MARKLSKQAQVMTSANKQHSRKFDMVVQSRLAKNAYNSPQAKADRKKLQIQGKIDQFRLADPLRSVENGKLVAPKKR